MRVRDAAARERVTVNVLPPPPPPKRSGKVLLAQQGLSVASGGLTRGPGNPALNQPTACFLIGQPFITLLSDSARVAAG